MKRILSFLIIIFLFTTFNFGQVPRTALMEYATNASCPPCASSNPGAYNYLKNNYGQLVSIWYHAWWPGSGDPMYVANIAENTNRINYYNVSGVPNYIIDGVYQGYPGHIASLRSHVNSRTQLESPVQMKVNTEIVGDSIEVSVEVVAFSTVTKSDLKLRTSIIEKMLIYPNPPGSNGEVDFPHVFRKFIGGVNGIDISSLSIGDSHTYTMKEEINSKWNRDELAIVTYIQAGSKEVIQAATDMKVHSIKSITPELEFVSGNQLLEYDYSITNFQSDSLKLRIKFNQIENNENWAAVLKFNEDSVDSFDVSLASFEKVDFSMELQTTNDPGHIKLNISAQNIGGETDYTAELDYLALLKAGKIVLIDDDGGADYEKNFGRALNNLGKKYTKIDHEILDEVKKVIDFSTEYQVVLWNIGENTPSLRDPDISLMMNYLNDGGRVFFSGSDFAHDIHDVQRLSTGKFFFRNYLDASYLTDSVTTTTLKTVTGNPLFENDFTLQVNPMYATLPDGVESVKAPDHMIMKYEGTEYYGMVCRELNEYKTVYLTCGLEQIDTEANQDLIIEKVLDWFAKPVVSVEKTNQATIPNKFSLEQNYPNPFNPSTSIEFALPVSNQVILTVFNSLGEKVSELVNEELSSGYHTVNFKSDNLSSGIYFYKIDAGNFVSVKKMLLLK